MKYKLKFFFICFILVSYISCINFFIIDGKTDQQVVEQNISIKKNMFKSYKLKINDTFSIEGSLISTIPPDMSSSVYFNNDNTTQPINGSNNKINDVKTIEQDSSSNKSKSVSEPPVSPQKLLTTAKPMLKNINNTQSNESNSISDNLVSILSGIIVESINNGNPTIINKSTSSLDFNARSNKNIILVSGKWNLDVQNGNVTDFNTKFAMIASNGTGFHWHSMNNFQSNEKLFLGNDNSATINGKLDFFTGDNNNTTKKTADVLLSINNLEIIQLTILNKEIADHFQGFPLYGIIDSIKIKN